MDNNHNSIDATVFRDLATLALWYFSFSNAPEGVMYSLKEVCKGAYNGEIKFNDDKALQSELPSCATWHNKKKMIIELNYEGGQIYRFTCHQLFNILNDFTKIASGIKKKEKEQLCQMIKTADVSGKELLLTVNLPKMKTKNVLRAADKYGLRPINQGLCVDKSGYIVASDGRVINVCKAEVEVEAQFDTDVLLPIDFAKFADGKTVHVYKSSDNYIAVCDNNSIKLQPCKYPDWKSVIGKIVDKDKKGKLKVNSSELIKACNKSLSIIHCNLGKLSVLRKDDNSESEVILPNIKPEFDCKIALKADVVRRVMPRCHTMYITKSYYPIYLLGDCYCSLLMPAHIEDAKYFDFIQGEESIDFMDLLNPNTQAEQQAETNKTTPLKPTALQLVIIRHLYARRSESSPRIKTMPEAINLIKQLRRQ